LEAESASVEEGTTVKLIANVTLEGDETVTVPAGVTLNLSTYTITGDGSAKIVVQGTGTITGTGATNFYYSDSTTAIAGTIPAGTYNWDTDKWKGTADAPTSKDAATPGEITWSPTSIVTINYTGSDPLGTINIPDNKKLIIKNAVVAGADDSAANKITVESGATLEIEGPSGSIDLGATGTITNSSGTVTNTGTVTTATPGVDALNTLLTKVNGNVTASAIEVGTTAELEVPAETTLTLTVVSVADSATLKVKATTGTINATVTPSGNAGTIEAADAATLANVLLWTTLNGKVSVVGNGEIVASGNTLVIPTEAILTVANGQELNVNGTLTATGNITNEGTIVLGTSGSIITPANVDNEGGTIKAVSVTQLEALLVGIADGTVEITAAEATLASSATVKAGVTLVLAANTKLTVPSTKTLTLGDGSAATLTLTNDTSKLVLEAGGKVSAANAESTIVGTGNAESAVTVSATTTADAPTGVKDTDSNSEDTVWVLTADASPESATVIIGKFKLVTGSSALTDIAGDTDGGAAGTLTAGTGTTITFAGAN
jgi:hypothetical protein